MDRRQFLRNASMLAAGVVAADQLDVLDRLLWEPKRLWTGWTPPNSLSFNTVRSLQELYAKTNTKLKAALNDVTPESQWLRKGELYVRLMPHRSYSFEMLAHG